MRPEVNQTVCQSCNRCEARLACKTRAIIRIDPGEPVFIELERCNGCANCVLACPFGAISIKNWGELLR